MQDYIKERKKTLAHSNNTIDISKKNSRKKFDISKIMCYICNKKGHYASTYIKLSRN